MARELSPWSPSGAVDDGTGRRSTAVRAGAWSVGFVAVLWVVQIVNALDHQGLDAYGVEPRSAHGLLGVAFAPVLHASWGHLLSNTLPVLVLGFLVLASDVALGLAATATVWVVGGLGVWALGPGNTDHLGASGLVFGWLTYLLARGVVTRDLTQIALGVVVFLVFGGVLLGVLPGTPGISWQGHLFGAVGGVLAAVLLLDRPGERAASA